MDSALVKTLSREVINKAGQIFKAYGEITDALECELLMSRSNVMKPKEHVCKKGASLKTSEPLMRRLAAYSASAGVALLAAPVAEATIQNINSLSLSLDLPQNGGFQSLPFNVGPFNGELRGSRATYKQTTYIPGTYFPGTPPYTGPSNTYFPGSPGFYNPGHAETIGTNRYGKASFYGNIANSGSYAKRFNKGDAFGSLSFGSSRHLLASKSYSGNAYGNFRGQSGYIAFQTGSYYGWLKVKVGLDSNGVPNQISLVDNGNGVYGAFDKIDDISADGFTIGAVAAPEPSIAAIGGLGLLAFGAAGVRELRRRRGQSKIQN